MNNTEIKKAADTLARRVQELSHPLLPKPILETIKLSGFLLCELAWREVSRHGNGE